MLDRIPKGGPARLKVSLTVPSRNTSVPLAVAAIPNTSAYQVAFTPAVKASHTLLATFNGSVLPGLPTGLTIVDEALQPQQWRISSTAFNATGGERALHDVGMKGPTP